MIATVTCMQVLHAVKYGNSYIQCARGSMQSPLWHQHISAFNLVQTFTHMNMSNQLH